MNYRKIDMYIDGKYLGSSTWYKTCREAISSCERQGNTGKIKANFAEKLPKRVKVHYYNTKLPQKGCICRLCKL